MAKEVQTSCKNIFKSNSEKMFREELTKKWIELINQAEKDKKNIVEQSLFTGPAL